MGTTNIRPYLADSYKCKPGRYYHDVNFLSTDGEWIIGTIKLTVEKYEDDMDDIWITDVDTKLRRADADNVIVSDVIFSDHG